MAGANRPNARRSPPAAGILGSFAVVLISVALAVPYMSVRYTSLLPVTVEHVSKDGGKVEKSTNLFGDLLLIFEHYRHLFSRMADYSSTSNTDIQTERQYFYYTVV
jgi:hypothetical protein